MGKYGEAALRATELVLKKEADDPRAAWEMAVREVFPRQHAAQDKNCPRGAYLGLCSEGLVEGIPPGDYTQSHRNRWYATEAVRLLESDPSLAADKKRLWMQVTNRRKAENGQIDVVLALWHRKLLSSWAHPGPLVGFLRSFARLLTGFRRAY